MNGADEYTAGMCGLQHIGGAVRRVLTKLGATGNGVKAEVSKGPATRRSCRLLARPEPMKE